MRTGFTLGQCVRQRVFWKIVIGIFLGALAQTGPFVQLIPILRDVGLEEFAAATTASLLGVAVIMARLLCGYLMDRFFAPFVAGVFLVAPVFGFIAFALEPSIWTAVLVTVLLGMAYGAEFDILGILLQPVFRPSLVRQDLRHPVRGLQPGGRRGRAAGRLELRPVRFLC